MTKITLAPNTSHLSAETAAKLSTESGCWELSAHFSELADTFGPGSMAAKPSHVARSNAARKQAKHLMFLRRKERCTAAIRASLDMAHQHLQTCEQKLNLAVKEQASIAARKDEIGAKIIALQETLANEGNAFSTKVFQAQSAFDQAMLTDDDGPQLLAAKALHDAKKSGDILKEEQAAQRLRLTRFQQNAQHVSQELQAAGSEVNSCRTLVAQAQQRVRRVEHDDAMFKALDAYLPALAALFESGADIPLGMCSCFWFIDYRHTFADGSDWGRGKNGPKTIELRDMKNLLEAAAPPDLSVFSGASGE